MSIAKGYSLEYRAWLRSNRQTPAPYPWRPDDYKQPCSVDYAPYDARPAFWNGHDDYKAGRSPEWRPDGNSVECQAYDRGAEYAMRLNRWDNRKDQTQ